MTTIGWRRTVGAVALVVATALVSGCGGDSAGEEAGEKLGEQLAEQALEDAGTAGVDVDVDGEDVTIESDEGTIKVGTGDLPEGFPAELSVVDGEIVSSVDTPQGSAVTVTVDDADAAFDEAVADLESNGWERVQLTETEGSKLAMYSKGEQTAMVMADSATGQLSYTIGTA